MEDYFRMLAGGLRANGHRVAFSAEPVAGRLNILIENFEERHVEAIRAAARESATRIVIIATEFLTGSTFNEFKTSKRPAPGARALRVLRALTPPAIFHRLPLGGKSALDDPYAHVANWQRRYENFMQVAPLAAGIWCASEYVVPGYREATGHPNVDHMHYGHVEGGTRIDWLPDEERDIDFFFSGTITPYREGLLTRLEDAGYRVVRCGMFTPNYIRDNIVSRSRVCLNLKQNADWPYASTSRFQYHLENRSLLLTEATRFSCELSQYVEAAPSEEFFEACLSMLAAGRFAERGREAHERFRAGTSFAAEMNRLLARCA